MFFVRNKFKLAIFEEDELDILSEYIQSYIDGLDIFIAVNTENIFKNVFYISKFNRSHVNFKILYTELPDIILEQLEDFSETELIKVDNIDIYLDVCLSDDEYLEALSEFSDKETSNLIKKIRKINDDYPTNPYLRLIEHNDINVDKLNKIEAENLYKEMFLMGLYTGFKLPPGFTRDYLVNRMNNLQRADNWYIMQFRGEITHKQVSYIHYLMGVIKNREFREIFINGSVERISKQSATLLISEMVKREKDEFVENDDSLYNKKWLIENISEELRLTT